jgi:hypothetical protein
VIMKGRQTFRYPPRERWASVGLAICCPLVLWFCITHPSRRPGRIGIDIAVDVLLSVGVIWFGTVAWMKSRTLVILDESEVRWRAGSRVRGLRWDQIEGVSVRQEARTVEWGLIEKGTGTYCALPFMHRTLFLALKLRLPIIPPEAEDRLLR